MVVFSTFELIGIFVISVFLALIFYLGEYFGKTELDRKRDEEQKKYFGNRVKWKMIDSDSKL